MVSLKNLPRLKVSVAKQSDRPLIARLCRRAVGRSDYVLRILPTTITRDALFLAWDGEALVGMTNFDRCMDGSGWLSMARTDPDWRGHGVAMFLQDMITAHAKREGVRTLRLWVLSGNKPSLRTCEKGKFKLVCEATHVSSRLRTRKPRTKIRPSSAREVQLQSLLKSNYLTKTQGYIGYRRHFMQITKPLLKRLRDEGELYWIKDSALLVSRPDTMFGRPQSTSTILQGPMAKSLNRAKEIAEGLGARILSCYAPYGSYEISVARRVGFRSSPWGKHCLVFEKKI